jgi:hypothetical protein
MIELWRLPVANLCSDGVTEDSGLMNEVPKSRIGLQGPAVDAPFAISQDAPKRRSWWDGVDAAFVSLDGRSGACAKHSLPVAFDREVP